MKNKIPFIIIVIGMSLLICSCSTNRIVGPEGTIASKDLPAETIEVTESRITPNLEAKLPANYTLAKIKSALEEYMNYRMWLYPEKVEGNYGKTKFDPYISKIIDVEVRIYQDNSGEKKVFAHTNIGEWLVIFETENGIVYGDGQVLKEDAKMWPQDNYEVIGAFSVKVPQPHKPNYGRSPRKEKMIAAAEAYVKFFCDDASKGSESKEWINTEVYIADFYEYQELTSTWYVRQDGYVWYNPVRLVEQNTEFEAVGVKGFGMKNIYTLDKFDNGRYMFESEIHDAVKQFRCLSNGKLGE
jgi:hypothetical protein